VPKFDLASIKIERGEWSNPEPDVEYKRYQLTGLGISPRLVPGQTQSVVAADSDEHSESGHLTESAQIRIEQTSKRQRKYESIKKDLALPRFHQMVNAAVNLIGWGSTYGAILEASEILKSRGVANNVLHFSQIWPFPAEFVTAVLKAAAVNIVIENNYSGQLAYLIRAETGISVTTHVKKWDGRPISAQFILDALKNGGI
jgi:2-oxoglutarate ferredoxin oxidoreductase subunit alpha